jgi:cell division protein FtsW (lipid II flippase)
MEVNVVAPVLLAAFIIDRLIASLMFVTTYSTISKRDDDAANEQRSEYRRKFVYFILSAILSVVALRFIPYDSLTIGTISDPTIKTLVMWLILVGGADRISDLIGHTAAPAPAKAKTEIHVSGTMTFDQPLDPGNR